MPSGDRIHVVHEPEMIKRDVENDIITTAEYLNSEETKLERLWRYTKCFLKKLIAFLVSHVGLTCMVVVYAMLGGVIFKKIEAPNEREVRKLVTTTKHEYLNKLLEYLNTSTTEDIFRKTQWLEKIDKILNDYKMNMHKFTQERNWDGKFGDEEYQWTFADSLLFSVTVITTIGYGHIAPRTTGGKLLTIAYAIFGIPLTMLCLRNIGNLMAIIFRMIYRHTCISLTYQYIRLKRRRLRKNTFQRLKQQGVLLKKWAIRKRSSLLIRVGSVNRIHESNSADKDTDSVHKASHRDTVRFEHLNNVDAELGRRDYRVRSMSLIPTTSERFDNRHCIYRELVEKQHNAPLRRNRQNRLIQSMASRRNTLCAIQELDTIENEYDETHSSANEKLGATDLRSFGFLENVQNHNYIGQRTSISSIESDFKRLHDKKGSQIISLRSSSVSLEGTDAPALPTLRSSLLSIGDLENEDLVLKQRLKSTREMVPISVVLLLMTGYMILGSMMFSPWEKWDFMTGFYFCFVTLTSIGFGDIVPGAGASDWDSDEKGVLIVLYLLFGMSLLAMSFHLIQEEVKHKCRKIGIKLGLLEDRLNKMLDRIGENV